jgi:hypothetical protein
MRIRSVQQEHQVVEHLRARGKNQHSAGKLKAVKYCQIMVVSNAMTRMRDFVKSSQAKEKLRGQWCYKFINCRGCTD